MRFVVCFVCFCLTYFLVYVYILVFFNSKYILIKTILCRYIYVFFFFIGQLYIARNHLNQTAIQHHVM